MIVPSFACFKWKIISVRTHKVDIEYVRFVINTPLFNPCSELLFHVGGLSVKCNDKLHPPGGGAATLSSFLSISFTQEDWLLGMAGSMRSFTDAYVWFTPLSHPCIYAQMDPLMIDASLNR